MPTDSFGKIKTKRSGMLRRGRGLQSESDASRVDMDSESLLPPPVRQVSADLIYICSLELSVIDFTAARFNIYYVDLHVCKCITIITNTVKFAKVKVLQMLSLIGSTFKN